jgi:hypothetical protein
MVDGMIWHGSLRELLGRQGSSHSGEAPAHDYCKKPHPLQRRRMTPSRLGSVSVTTAVVVQTDVYVTAERTCLSVYLSVYLPVCLSVCPGHCACTHAASGPTTVPVPKPAPAPAPIPIPMPAPAACMCVLRRRAVLRTVGGRRGRRDGRTQQRQALQDGGARRRLCVCLCTASKLPRHRALASCEVFYSVLCCPTVICCSLLSCPVHTTARCGRRTSVA